MNESHWLSTILLDRTYTHFLAHSPLWLSSLKLSVALFQKREVCPANAALCWKIRPHVRCAAILGFL